MIGKGGAQQQQGKRKGEETKAGGIKDTQTESEVLLMLGKSKP